MYRYLLAVGVPPRLTAVITALWFAVVALAVLYCLSEPQAELKYLAL